jgi:3-mercaptopyruvate sulfurtransferase SseA
MGPLKHHSVLLMCRSGNRAKLALEKLKQLQLIDLSKTEVFQGGILEWKKQGRPIEGEASLPLPLMRQVQLVSGLMAGVGSLLALSSHPNWIYLPLFVGTGLTVAGSTGFCGMALLLQKMPWNRIRTTSNL